MREGEKERDKEENIYGIHLFTRQPYIPEDLLIVVHVPIPVCMGFATNL